MAQPSTFAGNGEGKVTTASALGFGNFPFVEILLRPWVPSPRTRRALNDDPPYFQRNQALNMWVMRPEEKWIPSTSHAPMKNSAYTMEEENQTADGQFKPHSRGLRLTRNGR